MMFIFWEDFVGFCEILMTEWIKKWKVEKIFLKSYYFNFIIKMKKQNFL